MTTPSNGNLAARRAIEALRNGVPNFDAVRILGCSQPQAETLFDQLLAGDTEIPGRLDGLRGLLIEGGFGTGKSHLLTHFQARALDQGFVCSKVSISKETPLFNLDRVFKSAVNNAQVPGRKGRLVEDLELHTKIDTEAYGDFFGWVANEKRRQRLNGIFEATLIAYEKLEDPAMKSRIEGFWSGDRINSAELKRALRQVRERAACGFRSPRLADLPNQRLPFMVRMIKGAGYKGWVVLLDELELIGFYPFLQRSRAYGELVRWLGDSKGFAYPGMIPVGTVTDDFASVVLSPAGRKKDLDNIGPKLRAKPRYVDLAEPAERGMRLLGDSPISLVSPSEPELHAAMERLREIYSEAYGWDAPPSESVSIGGVGIERRIRYKVRAAINAWDLQRLGYTQSAEIEAEEFEYSFDESAEMEPTDSGDDGVVAPDA